MGVPRCRILHSRRFCMDALLQTELQLQKSQEPSIGRPGTKTWNDPSELCECPAVNTH